MHRRIRSRWSYFEAGDSDVTQPESAESMVKAGRLADPTCVECRVFCRI